LISEDCFILDAYFVIFVWVGTTADETEKKIAYETAIEYMEKAPDGRPIDTGAVFVIQQGTESLVFTTHFHGFDWSAYPKGQERPLYGELEIAENILKEYDKKWTYLELVNKQYPPGINTAKLEDYMSDSEFEKVFEATREEFNKYPAWKQQKMKRSLGLF